MSGREVTRMAKALAATQATRGYAMHTATEINRHWRLVLGKESFRIRARVVLRALEVLAASEGGGDG
uniref:Uncharacterized protein n=1 Tax=viral metagenome TaxID=1070528 RepID=A0A6H1ZA38_9ZZZZ